MQSVKEESGANQVLVLNAPDDAQEEEKKDSRNSIDPENSQYQNESINQAVEELKSQS